MRRKRCHVCGELFAGYCKPCYLARNAWNKLLLDMLERRFPPPALTAERINELRSELIGGEQ